MLGCDAVMWWLFIPVLIASAPPREGVAQASVRRWSAVHARRGTLPPAWTGSANVSGPQPRHTKKEKKGRGEHPLLGKDRASILRFMKSVGWGGQRMVKLWGRKRLQYYVSDDLRGPRCISLLLRLGIKVEPAPHKGRIKTPIHLLDPHINGIRLTWYWGRGYEYVFDCRLALALYMAAPIIRKYGFDELLFTSIYRYTLVRGTRHLSRHAYGMAIDVRALRGPGGLFGVIERDWIRVEGTPKDCIGPVPSGMARRLRAMVCELETMPIFRRILTPDNDRGHRDHLHMAAPFPGERWFRRRYAGHVHGRPMPRYRHKRKLSYPPPPRPKDMKP